jgi:hypothetical protein
LWDIKENFKNPSKVLGTDVGSLAEEEAWHIFLLCKELLM